MGKTFIELRLRQVLKFLHTVYNRVAFLCVIINVERSQKIDMRNWDKKLKEHYSLEIIDVTEDPASVLKANIFSTPTLVKELPSPYRVVLGDLSDREKLSAAIEISLKEK